MTYPFNAPLLDFLILSIIGKEDSYGYQISQRLKSVAAMKDSTLYPILKRLSDNGFVDTYDQPFQGRNRKYYRITESGKKQQEFLLSEWKAYTQAIDCVIYGEETTERGGNNEYTEDDSLFIPAADASKQITMKPLSYSPSDLQETAAMHLHSLHNILDSFFRLHHNV